MVTDISWFGTNYSFQLNPVPAGTVTVSGTSEVGSVLTATTAGWADATLSYVWSDNAGQSGSLIDGATSSTYIVTADHVGHKITAWVTGSKTGFLPTTVQSDQTVAVTAPQKPAAPAPAADAASLSSYLASNSITPATQTSTGLPSGALNPTQTHTANVTWTGADSFVDVYAYSTPLFIGAFPVVNGVAQIVLSPAIQAQLAAGAHTLVITGQSSGTVQAVAVSISSVLASTGTNPALPLTAGTLLLLLGVALVLVPRRRVVSHLAR